MPPSCSVAGASRLAAVLLAILLLSGGSSLAEDICEGCWELGGRGSVLLPGSDTGLEPVVGLGGFGSFHFRPYWSVEFSLDRHPGAIEDGPDETLTLFSVRGAYTLRSARDQRHRPFIYLGVGIAADQIGTIERTISTPAGPVTARTDPDSDTGVAYLLGGGGLSHLKGRLWLRYEGQWLTWSTFGLQQDGVRLMATLTWRMGR